MKLDSVRAKEIRERVRAHVAAGSNILTAEFGGCVGQVFCHTNTVEGFVSLFKRAVIGIHHHVSPKHLDRYRAMATYRCNTRGTDGGERVNLRC